MFRLEALQARHGDCLLMHWGSEDDPHLALIDGGPSGVYIESLRPRLIELAHSRDRSLSIDLLMLSHIDDDHIKGLLEFAEELETARGKLSDGPNDVRVVIRRIWHNSLEELLDDPIGDAEARTAALSILASTARREIGWDETCDQHEASILASVPQGQLLHGYAKRLHWPLNSPFRSPQLVLRRSRCASVQIDKLSLHIVAPGAEELDRLRTVWKLKRKEGILAAFKDESPYNLSSIVALATYEDRRILLTGDARGDVVLQGLTSLQLLDDEGRIHVDVLKLPHHGSKNNVTPDFFDRVTADHYVVSGDRIRFPNPAQDSMQWLREARDGAQYRVHCTHEFPDMRALFGERLVTPPTGLRSITVDPTKPIR